jgi:Septum formation
MPGHPARPLSALRAALTGLAAAVVVSGCTASPSATPSEPPSSSPAAASVSATASAAATGSAAAAPAVAPRPPPRAACYRLTSAQLTRATNASPAVPCTSTHTSRTILVGRLAALAPGRPTAAASPVVQARLASSCRHRLASYVGGATRTRDLSRFNVVWYTPSLAETERGARWFRCDLIVFARAGTLLPLPRKAPLEGVLARPDALDTYGLCGTAAPGTADFDRVVCSYRHSWRAIDTIALPGGRAYPGVSAVRKAGEAPCKDAARSRAPDTLKFSYGWEWPTAEQWSAGQRFGYCWVPS